MKKFYYAEKVFSYIIMFCAILGIIGINLATIGISYVYFQHYSTLKSNIMLTGKSVLVQSTNISLPTIEEENISTLEKNIIFTIKKENISTLYMNKVLKLSKMKLMETNEEEKEAFYHIIEFKKDEFDIPVLEVMETESEIVLKNVSDTKMKFGVSITSSVYSGTYNVLVYDNKTGVKIDESTPKLHDINPGEELKVQLKMYDPTNFIIDGEKTYIRLIALTEA